MKKILKTICLISFFYSQLFLSTNANATDIAYEDHGNGTPLILIHAFPTDKQLWQPQKDLAKHFRLITLDLWGFGQSSSTNGQAVTMEDYADEIKELMDLLSIKKAVIGGESMGGYIALAFYAKYPSQVEGLILSDTQAIADSLDAKAKREMAAVHILEQGTAGFISTFMNAALSPFATKETKDALLAILQRQVPMGLASALRGMSLRIDTMHLLKKATIPILILTGKEDSVISPEQSKAMHAQTKNSKLVIIEEAGHLSNLEQPKQWNAAVLDAFN